MSDSVTIVSESAALGELLAAVRLAVPEATLEIEGLAESWEKIHLRTADASLRLTSMKPVPPGDRFSKLVLGMHNHFRNDAREAGAAGAALRKRVLVLQLAIGGVAEPSLKVEAWIQRAGATATRSVDGMLFDGRALRASDGTALLGPGTGLRGSGNPGS